MRVAVTGTPGTGKSSACKQLSLLGFRVVDLNALAAERGLVRRSRRPGTPGIVDVARLRRQSLPGGRLTFTYSHFAHMLGPDLVVVLRCSPKVLRSRLEARGWQEKKIRENLEAEAIDLITIEAMDACKKVYEVDTTAIKADEAARQIIEIVKGSVKGHEPGLVDWSEDILSWY